MGRRGKALLLTGSIVLLATLAVLLLTVEPWEGIMPMAACGMLWAETALFGGLLAVETVAKKLQNTFFRAACVTALSIYGACAFGYSLVCLRVLPHALTAFWVGHILLLAVAATALVVLASVGIREKNAQSLALQTMQRIESYVNRLEELALAFPGTPYAEELQAAAEALRYADAATPVTADAELETCVQTLTGLLARQDPSEETVSLELTRLNALIQKRRRQLRSAKRGSF